MAALIRWGRSYFERRMHKFGALRSGLLIIRFTSFLILLHLSQVLLWAAFYRWLCFPGWETAFYFSTATYSTVGYGDIVLPRVWRTLGPVESLTGVLMCGLSASFLFAVVARLVGREASHHAG